MNPERQNIKPEDEHFRSAKVTTILRLIQPLGLGSGPTCLAAFRFCTVLLSATIVRARKKKLSAMETLAS
jgi:hypothetical protein